MRVRKKCFISCFDKCLLSLSLLKHLHSMMRWVDGRLISFYFIRSVSVLIRGLSIFERSIQCDRRPSLSWILTATLRCTISVSRRYFVPPPLDALSFRIWWYGVAQVWVGSARNCRPSLSWILTALSYQAPQRRHLSHPIGICARALKAHNQVRFTTCGVFVTTNDGSIKFVPFLEFIFSLG